MGIEVSTEDSSIIQLRGCQTYSYKGYVYTKGVDYKPSEPLRSELMVLRHDNGTPVFVKKTEDKPVAPAKPEPVVPKTKEPKQDKKPEEKKPSKLEIISDSKKEDSEDGETVEV